MERHYSQTEKEALAIVWACERFHVHLCGIEFELYSDHEPAPMPGEVASVSVEAAAAQPETESKHARSPVLSKPLPEILRKTVEKPKLLS